MTAGIEATWKVANTCKESLNFPIKGLA